MLTSACWSLIYFHPGPGTGEDGVLSLVLAEPGPASTFTWYNLGTIAAAGWRGAASTCSAGVKGSHQWARCHSVLDELAMSVRLLLVGPSGQGSCVRLGTTSPGADLRVVVLQGLKLSRQLALLLLIVLEPGEGSVSAQEELTREKGWERCVEE